MNKILKKMALQDFTHLSASAICREVTQGYGIARGVGGGKILDRFSKEKKTRPDT